MILSNSGATITFLSDGIVEKSGGPHDLHLQAALCSRIGPALCPRIIALGPDSYRMERLQDYPPCTSQQDLTRLLLRVRGCLMGMVWTKSPFTVAGLWRTNCANWIKLSNVDWLPPPGSVYSSDDEARRCLTHGDPTLANVMQRPQKMVGFYQICLIDATPPRPGISELREVDVGKLLQSAAGWEHALDPKHWIKSSEHQIDNLLEMESSLMRMKALYWAAFHCARITKRATRPDLVMWGQVNGRMFVDRMRKMG